MRRFITQCSLIALLLVVTLAVAEAYMRSIPNVYAYKDEYMRERHNSIKTLILGNSFSYEGIDPNQLNCAFNLANSAQNPEHDAYLLEHYAPYDSLKTVIIPLAGNLFVTELENTPSLSHRAGYYQRFMGYNKHSRLSKYEFEISNLNVCRAKIEAYNALRHNGKKLACDSLGFGPESAKEKSSNWTNLGLAPQLKESELVANTRANLPHFERIANFCLRSGIRLIVVAMPQWRNNVPIPQHELATIDSVGNLLCHRYHAEYRNYLFDKRFNADDFFDARHLSDIGAHKFTTILREEMTIE